MQNKLVLAILVLFGVLSGIVFSGHVPYAVTIYDGFNAERWDFWTYQNDSEGYLNYSFVDLGQRTDTDSFDDENESFWLYDFRQMRYRYIDGMLLVNGSNNDPSAEIRSALYVLNTYSVSSDVNMSVWVDLVNTSDALEGGNASVVLMGLINISNDDMLMMCGIGLNSTGVYGLYLINESEGGPSQQTPLESGTGILGMYYNATNERMYCSFDGVTLDASTNIIVPEAEPAIGALLGGDNGTGTVTAYFDNFTITYNDTVLLFNGSDTSPNENGLSVETNNSANAIWDINASVWIDLENTSESLEGENYTFVALVITGADGAGCWLGLNLAGEYLLWALGNGINSTTINNGTGTLNLFYDASETGIICNINGQRASVDININTSELTGISIGGLLVTFNGSEGTLNGTGDLTVYIDDFRATFVNITPDIVVNYTSPACTEASSNYTSTIVSALGNATDGDTIVICNDTTWEIETGGGPEVRINKSINLHGYGSGAAIEGSAFSIRADYTNVSNLIISMLEPDQPVMDIDSASHSALYGNTAIFCWYGFLIINGNYNTIEDNLVDFSVGGSYILFGGGNNTIKGNTARNPSEDGFVFWLTTDNMIRNNLAYNSVSSGFSALSAHNNTFWRNTAYNNMYGFQIMGSNDNLFLDNTATDNERGFSFSRGSSNNSGSANEASDNERNIVETSGASGNDIQ